VVTIQTFIKFKVLEILRKMAEKDKLKRDYETFSWAPAMQRIATSDPKYLIGALEGNAIKQGSNGKGLEALITGTISNEQSIRSAIAYTASQHNAEIKGVTVGEYLGNHEAILKEYFGEDIPNIDEYKDIELFKHQEDMNKLKYSASDKNPNKEERESASEELEKYETLNTILSIIQDNTYKELLPEAIERSNHFYAKEIILKNKLKE